MSRSATSLSLCDCTNRCVHGRLKTLCMSASRAGRSLGGQFAVDQLAVVARGGGHVEWAFLASLDLETRDTGRAQGGHMVRQSQVFHREGKPLARIAAHRGAVAEREGSVGYLIGIAARVGALAAIAAAAERLGREQTQAAVRITQGAVNENFRLDAGRGRDVADLLECQLAGQDNAAEAETAQSVGPGAIVDAQLRAGVQLHIGEVLADQVIHAEVLNDEGVHADVGEGRDRFDQFGQFILTDQCVDSHEDAAARLEAVSIGGDLRLLRPA